MVFKVKVISIGKSKENWLDDAISLYEKRLEGKMELDWTLLENNKALEERALKEPILIALDIQGKTLTSEQFSYSLFTKWGLRPTFVIGGATGLSPKIIGHAKVRISFSSLTFTHQMIRLILIEQLYRAIQIQEGSSYHK